MKIKQLLFACVFALSVLCASVLPAAAADTGEYRSGVFSYRLLDDDTAEITRVYFEEDQTSLEIPDELEGHTVTGLGYYAMGNYAALEEVTLPDTLTYIGNGTFSLCRMLFRITLPDSLIKIDTAAFFGCESLESITIPDGVLSIENTAFRQCRSLMRVSIPESVNSIGKMAFFECDSLKSIMVPSTVSRIGERAFGYTLSGSVIPVDDFVMICEEGTYAFDYAVENGFWYGTNGYFCGDADGNGVVALTDVTAVQYLLAELSVPSFDERAADVDGDGVEINDATWIRRYLAEIEIPYPVGDYVRITADP